MMVHEIDGEQFIPLRGLFPLARKNSSIVFIFFHKQSEGVLVNYLEFLVLANGTEFVT